MPAACLAPPPESATRRPDLDLTPRFLKRENFTDGVLFGDLLIRQARGKDRGIFEKHYKTAMRDDSPLSETLIRNFAGLGSMIIAMAVEDHESWRNFAQTKPLLNDFWRATTLVLVAERNGQVIGSIMVGSPRFQLEKLVSDHKRTQRTAVTEDLRDEVILLTMASAKLFSLAVDPSAQRQGVGKSLVEAALSIFDQGQYGVIWGQCPENAIPFYAKLGFDFAHPSKPMDVKGYALHWTHISGGGEDEWMFAARLRTRNSVEVSQLAMARGLNPLPEKQVSVELDVSWAPFSLGPHAGLIVTPTIEAWSGSGLSRSAPWPETNELQLVVDMVTGEVTINSPDGRAQQVTLASSPADIAWLQELLAAGKCRLMTTAKLPTASFPPNQLTGTLPVIKAR